MSIPPDASYTTQVLVRNKRTKKEITRFFPLTTLDAAFAFDYAKHVSSPFIKAVTRSKGLKDSEVEVLVSTMNLVHISVPTSQSQTFSIGAGSMG